MIDTARVEDVLDQHLRGQVPGAALALTHAGEPLFTRCFGLADLARRQPVQPTTVFRLASVTKPFTALVIMLLERDGLLDVDAPIRDYLPGYPAHAARVTVRHLLTHTSGIPNYIAQPSYAEIISDSRRTDADLLACFADRELDFEPGSRYGYSNSGYRLLDMIAEHVTGTPFGAILAERVFTPAKMHHSYLVNHTSTTTDHARGYIGDSDNFSEAAYFNIALTGGAGRIGSTLADLLRFDRALRTESIADADLQCRLFSPVQLTTGRREGYGLGWRLGTYRGHRLIYHGGGIPGYTSLYVRLPDDDLGIVLLTNLGRFPCTNFARRLIDAALDQPPVLRCAIPLPQSTVDARAGVYADTDYRLDITAESGLLIVSFLGRRHRMAPVDQTTYVAQDDPDITLTFHDGGPERACTLNYPLWWCTVYRLTQVR
ncbi:CubicO group peptidase (beta-lactamase class C family) [Kutzneria buriramensis]|uniref:CubicO group peptidase (Beta-lactamase class C family) n=2 Tax=Kutzneria buriramensis TaxID=1045776 RepID=A0A3E0H037_9PSEU|nr:CubicO group peptidase (beta-lactamase class C family) [Kutzneria buriramensis]